MNKTLNLKLQVFIGFKQPVNQELIVIINHLDGYHYDKTLLQSVVGNIKKTNRMTKSSYEVATCMIDPENLNNRLIKFMFGCYLLNVDISSEEKMTDLADKIMRPYLSSLSPDYFLQVISKTVIEAVRLESGKDISEEENKRLITDFCDEKNIISLKKMLKDVLMFDEEIETNEESTIESIVNQITLRMPLNYDYIKKARAEILKSEINTELMAYSKSHDEMYFSLENADDIWLIESFNEKDSFASIGLEFDSMMKALQRFEQRTGAAIFVPSKDTNILDYLSILPL